MLTSHVKRSSLLWLNTKSRLLQGKWNDLVFHRCLYNKLNTTCPFGDTKCPRTRVEKCLISARPCNILCILSASSWFISVRDFTGVLFAQIFSSVCWNIFGSRMKASKTLSTLKSVSLKSVSALQIDVKIRR